jgi:hypothetical protein
MSSKFTNRPGVVWHGIKDSSVVFDSYAKEHFHPSFIKIFCFIVKILS